LRPNPVQSSSRSSTPCTRTRGPVQLASCSPSTARVSALETPPGRAAGIWTSRTPSFCTCIRCPQNGDTSTSGLRQKGREPTFPQVSHIQPVIARTSVAIVRDTHVSKFADTLRRLAESLELLDGRRVAALPGRSDVLRSSCLNASKLRSARRLALPAMRIHVHAFPRRGVHCCTFTYGNRPGPSSRPLRNPQARVQ
jgi:hypothetical protein